MMKNKKLIALNISAGYGGQGHDDFSSLNQEGKVTWNF